MITTLQMIDGNPVLLFDDEWLKSIDLREGDSVNFEFGENGVITLTPIRDSPSRQSI